MIANQRKHNGERSLDMWSNYNRIQWTFALTFSQLLLLLWEAISNTVKECFIRLPNTSNLVKKNSATPRFFNPLRVWKCCLNTLPRVLHITSKLNPASLQCVFFLIFWVMKRQELFLPKIQAYYWETLLCHRSHTSAGKRWFKKSLISFVKNYANL